MIAALLVAGLAGACASGPTLVVDREEVGSTANSPRLRGRFGAWSVQARVPDPRLGPLLVKLGPLGKAPTRGTSRLYPDRARSWIHHDLRFSNTAGRAVWFGDTRTSKFLRRNGPRLLAADEGCGYSFDPNSPVRPGACMAYLDVFAVRPDASVTREITLFKELAGMAHLQEGVYRFDRHVAFRVGRDGKRYRGTIALLYYVERRPSP